MVIQHFFDPDTFTLTYVVFDPETKDAVIIDPVLDFDPPSGVVTEKSATEVFSFVRESNLRVHFILETHAHADHLSGSQVLKREFPTARIAVSDRIRKVQEIFSRVFNVFVKSEGKDFDFLFGDDETFPAGSIRVTAIPTPGHTPACTSFLIGENLFTGDALFMPDSGTGRCDFPGGSASQLFDSVQKIYSLPDQTRIFVGHDYQPNGRELRFQTSVGESKRDNNQLRGNTSRHDFIFFRETRDKTLKAPRLLLPSLQVNIRAGHLPEPDETGTMYLKLPLKIKGRT